MKKINYSRFRTLWLAVFLMFVSTGCIEIVEEITVQKDQSGTVLYRIETNGAGGLLDGLAGLFDVSIEDNVRREAEKLIRELQSQEGISDLQYNLRGRSGDYFLQFHFSNSDDFNKALYAVSGNKKTMFSPGYLKIGNNGIRKFNFAPWIKRYLEKENMELPAGYITDNIRFRSTLNTPEDIIRIKTRQGYKLVSSRTSTQRFGLTDILNGDVNTGIRVRY